MTDQTPISDADLNAYVDGQLDEAGTARVEAWVEQNPDAAEQVREYRALNHSLRGVYGSILERDVPGGMLLRSRRRTSPVLRVAAVLAWLVLGGLVGWLAHDARVPSTDLDSIVARAIAAHVVFVPEVRHPVEVGSSERNHLNAWMSKRLQHPVLAPDLQAVDYRLLGGRLLVDSGQPAAQFMYEEDSGERMTLYVRSNPGQPESTAFHYTEAAGVRSVYWLDGSLAFAIVGDSDRDELARVADAAYRQFNP
jgi:anti-sigma factor RsiW